MYFDCVYFCAVPIIINARGTERGTKSYCMTYQEKKGMIITLAMLKAEGKKIAFVKGNRIPSKGNILSKRKSLHNHGLVVPIVIADAPEVDADGVEVMEVVVENETENSEKAENSDSSLKIELIDGVTLKPIPKDELENYVFILEGQHRYLAYLLNEAEKVENKGSLYFIFPLNPEVTARVILSQANIATVKWSGGEFVQGAKILMADKELPLLDAILELVNAGYTLPTASYWCTFHYGKITKDMLADAMEGKIHNNLNYTAYLERGKRLLTAARKTVKEDFLKHRYMMDFLKSKYDASEDSIEIMNRLENFLKSLEESEVNQLANAKGEKGVRAKEQVVINILNELYNKRYQK